MRLRRRWRRRLGLAEDDFIFLFPGGIRAVKDALLLLRAFRRLERKHSRARLLFVGPILEEGYGRRFRRALRGRPSIRYQAAVPPGEMPGVYAAADVVVNSSHSESLSNALLEAMALGVPVLARAIEGNRPLVAHNRTGLLFSTERDFARQAERLLNDSSLRRRLAERARRHLRRHYSLKGEIRAHLHLYHRLVGVKRRD